MIATLLSKISITTILFYWRNDTSSFVPENVSPLSCSSGLVRHTLLFVYFLKELISFIGFLDKCHTSVFQRFDLFCSDRVNSLWLAVAVSPVPKVLCKS